VDPVQSVVQVRTLYRLAWYRHDHAARRHRRHSAGHVLAEPRRINLELRTKLDEVKSGGASRGDGGRNPEIIRPMDVMDAKTRQMSASAPRAAPLVTESEGKRQATVTGATGDKDAAILRAEGSKQAAISGAEVSQRTRPRALRARQGLRGASDALMAEPH